MIDPIPGDRLALPDVTLCAVSSVNVAATLRAMEISLQQVAFGACKLFTDKISESGHPDIAIVPIPELVSSEQYSHFLLSTLADYIETSHCLVVQWDGHVIDATRWDPDFLAYDYVGARWPQFSDGWDVGNGGFSLRSRHLMKMVQEAGFRSAHPEDIAIGRTHRGWLEDRGIRFAPGALADRFSAERAGDPRASFGYHGIWHMADLMPSAVFWEIYRNLDDRNTVWHDFRRILKQVHRGPGGYGRALRLFADRVRR